MAARHRLAVLPGLAESRSNTASANELGTALATLDGRSNQRQLVPLSPPSKMNLRDHNLWNGANSIRSRESEESLGNHFQAFVSRLNVLEEANKAILEEVYRLQGNLRASDQDKKQIVKEEKMAKRELMQTIRSSNDIISQLTIRLRNVEQKLHKERENTEKLTSHSRKLEQALFNTQKENDDQRDSNASQIANLKHRVEELARQKEVSDRTSENIVDDFHQMKSKIEIQGMEFTHSLNETKQRFKRLDDEIKQGFQQARMQKDTNTIAEQNSLQLRHLLEARMNESRDSITEIRDRISQSDNSNRTETKQLMMKITELKSTVGDLSHKRQEEIQSIEKNRKEHDHTEESERMKLQNKIQIAVEEMSDKLLQKEVRLREEALRKFIELEKMLQKEENSRAQFENQLREETDSRWNLQQKVYLEELQVMKEMRRAERQKHTSNYKRIDEVLTNIQSKQQLDRKAIEKVIMAEITKREEQIIRTRSLVDGAQEQLRVALSSMQQSISGVQFQMRKEKDQLTSEFANRFGEEDQKLIRAVADFDARLTSISMRITQQDDSLEAKFASLKDEIQKQQNEDLKNTADWKEGTNSILLSMQESIHEIPQAIKETQERLDIFKSDNETRMNLQKESALNEGALVRKQTKALEERIDQLQEVSMKENMKLGSLERDLISAQGTASQMERIVNDARSSMNVRINSETKMRLEENYGIKKDLAKLTVDIEPVLWQHNRNFRNFVKINTSTLNKWGLYQCARWYDIKMRWLRLLKKNKRRKSNETKTPAISRHTTQESLRSKMSERSISGVNRSLDEVNRSPDEVNRSPDQVNRSPDGVNRSPDEVNRSPDEVNRSPDGVNRSPNGVNRSPDGVNRSSADNKSANLTDDDISLHGNDDDDFNEVVDDVIDDDDDVTRGRNGEESPNKEIGKAMEQGKDLF